MRNVLPLFDSRHVRLAELRQWFTEQSAVPTIAAVSVSLTADGLIKTKGCGIEPENARLLLDRLDALRNRLEAIATGQAPAVSVGQPHQCEVIPLRRSA